MRKGILLGRFLPVLSTLILQDSVSRTERAERVAQAA